MRKHYLFTAVLLLALVLASIASASPAVAANNGVSVQLAMMLDGSGSISDDNWTIMVTGLHDAVENPDCVPQDGSVELTVIQFGDYGAVLEVGPVVITSGNAASVANQIQVISQLKGYTPIACAIRLAADVLAGSTNFHPSLKQALNLVTDGRPNVCCAGPGYTGNYCGFTDGEDSAEAARGYALTTLQMTDPSDEFDAEFVGVQGTASDWLKDEIVWPEPGYYFDPPSFPYDGPGWVRVVADATEFAATICEKFEVIIEPASKTFNLTITGCEPEDVVYKVSLAGGAYQTMTGSPPSYTFTSLIVGQTYSYAIKADDTEILSGTTGPLVEGTNVNNLSYQWPCASKTFNLTITGCEPEDVAYKVSLAGGAYQTMTGTPPSYNFSGLIVGQTYSYSIKADGTEILSGTTGELEEGKNLNNLSYQWPCASITIKKQTDPDGGTGFSFTGTGFPAGCSLDSFTLDDDEQESCDNLEPGTYVITESDVAGWDLTDISCSGDATVKFGDGINFPHASFVAGDTSVEITLGAGESATCTFTNKEQVPVTAIINLTKTPTDGAGHKITQAYVDDTITYVFEVENTSSVDLINVTLTDDTGICDAALLRGADKVGNNDNILEPGEVWAYTCSHVVSADDDDPLINKAIARGMDAQSVWAEDDDDASVDILTGPPPVGGEAYPVNKLAILVPWITLAALLAGSISWFALRRREARS